MEIYAKGAVSSVYVYHLYHSSSGTRKQNPLHPWDIYPYWLVTLTRFQPMGAKAKFYTTNCHLLDLRDMLWRKSAKYYSPFQCWILTWSVSVFTWLFIKTKSIMVHLQKQFQKCQFPTSCEYQNNKCISPIAFANGDLSNFDYCFSISHLRGCKLFHESNDGPKQTGPLIKAIE